MTQTANTFNSRTTLAVNGREYVIHSLPAAEENGLSGISRLPFTLKVLLENLLRHEDGRTVTADDIRALVGWLDHRGTKEKREIAFRPARVLMQDFTGVPAVVDLAAMRDAMRDLGGDPKRINPLSPVDLVIDHSVMVDRFGTPDALAFNRKREYERNRERYTFLKWGQQAFSNFSVVPPETGIVHQVNLEYLARAVWTREENGSVLAFPDTVVGTDSHTTMINGLGVLGWGVGGIEAEAVMLGQPVSMLIPEVVGFELTGELPEGVTATDLVLTIVQMLREEGVVGKFVEFCGDGLDHLSLEDQATIANMAPEYGATCGFFPISRETLDYLRVTGRSEEQIALVEAYARAQGLFREAGMPVPEFTKCLKLDLSTVQPSIAGPKRPQDRVLLSEAPAAFARAMKEEFGKPEDEARMAAPGADFDLGHGDVVIAAITSCTNTSNPSVMLAAGLLARKAAEKGLKVKPWVKTSLAPGSQVVTEYLKRAGVLDDLEKLGFAVVAYGCTTCIGNSGPLPEPVARAIEENDLVACSVLSGNRNFEGRVNPLVKANWLASPPLVVAYAIAGSLKVNLATHPIGTDAAGNPVYLRDIWPSSAEVREAIRQSVTREAFQEKYADVFSGDEDWQAIDAGGGETYAWDEASTYIRRPPYFDGMSREVPAAADITNARILGLFGDSITTDHISPAGAIPVDSPAGQYLIEHGVEPKDFNSYGARRGNHEVMMRGTFANIRLQNEMTPDVRGGWTVHYPSGERMTMFDAAMRYRQEGVPLVVIAGKEYGTGSSRDWAAKGPKLLGVAAAIAESFERIHRSNLIGMGVLPLQFMNGENRKTLGLTGAETVSITGIAEGLRPGAELTVTFTAPDGTEKRTRVLCRIDTEDELDYYLNDGILPYMLRKLAGLA
ncbi:aconitate hydratase AcnA [Thermopetrobacter sp. TC1]|uniref:aconitate hydratase AcnA n=1 Tax=Thermopetrobacter sp. TC1 TaxID=1495045 RepID=UPI00057190EE|nr:aconitate hydratase AcnA [Thermopetrobacter sp. TC1]